MQYALLGLLVILVLVQAFLLWKARTEWRWYEITAIIVTTILAVVFVFPVAGALKSRSEWHKVKENLDARLAKAKAEQKELRDGDRNNPLSDQGALPLAQKLAAIGIEAGRRWRGLRFNNANFNGQPTIVLSKAPEADNGNDPLDAPPAGDGGEAGEEDAEPLPLIPESMVVYGFGEGRGPNIEVPVPTRFLGEFRVTASSPTQVTLTPTGPLLPEQQRLIEQGNARSWSVYELLPLDGHGPFIAEGSAPDDDNIFGRVDDQLINAILQNASEETRRNYLRDGARSLPDDEPLSRWVKIEFTKNHTITVDSPDQYSALEGGFFDGSGRAVDSRLQVGDKGQVQFAKGDLLVVKEEAATALRAEGVARLVDEYYLRPLNDYRFVLRRIRLRIAELDNRAVQLNFEKDVLQKAIDATVKMLASYQTDKLLLEQDFEQFEKERKALEDYNKNLRANSKATREKLVRLYRSNQALEEELEQIHRSIQERVNSLTSSEVR
ncbi:coiled-coil domain-containing protein [Rhodopirellula sallentina]|uniref:Myosin heavy chain, neuronal-like protein n=1 Tax=Rhodopirellula sallentina SM41 TaxID=1263870 RepID=M5TSP5_9BACT|nr:hypothetical protein [Rhodopirellula sallentina]EMI52180.1 myosin heavy chain, neuronal-like protein [Rhodopirellula sallentina SM41]